MENTTPVKEIKKIPNTNDIYPKISKELITEINNMLSYAIYNGILINTEVNSLIESKDLNDLINAHNLLVKNIAPATPKSIEYTKTLRSEGNGKSIFNKLPIVRNLIFLTLFFLVLFIGTALSPDVNNSSLDKGLMDNSGLPLLLNLTFLASIAGLGVVFHLLKKVSDSIKESTMVSEECISYIAHIILGIVAGLIMSEIISVYTSTPENIDLFNKGALALIGGFSSEAIFSILQGIIDRLKSVFIMSKN
ncbi:hypothetical protein [Tenacibaculum sp.]|uniref:hypothetical protein n=1 Tax=Tenacibaculum sp. TaxID=1906242 RepID=UPI003D0F3ACD